MAIVKKGEPLVDEFIVETATNMIPGRLVKKGTTDEKVVVNDGTSPVGWLGYEQTAARYQPANDSTAYAAGDVVAVLRGHIKIKAHLASGQSVAMGDPLTGTSAGELAAATVGTNEIVAYAAETVDASGGAADIEVWSVI